MHLVKIEEVFANQILIPSFQRRLSLSRIKKITESGVSLNLIPPILVAHTESGYLLVDGQHRFEAWKKSNFPMMALVYKTEYKKAQSDFVRINMTAMRLQFKHVLKIDDSDYADYVRGLAEEFNINPLAVHDLMLGYFGESSLSYQSKKDFKLDDIKMILAHWVDDKRWKAEGYIYTRQGVLKLLGQLCRKYGFSAIKEFKKMDFSENGKMAKFYASSGTGQKLMRQEFEKKYVNSILKHVKTKVIGSTENAAN